jgi:hypothetical protein
MKSIVELLVKREDGKIIESYCERNEKLIQNPKTNNLHSTVYFSSSFPIFGDLKLLREINKHLPIMLEPETYFFDIFENCLFLRYENRIVRDIKDIIISDIERQKKEVWPNLNDNSMKMLEQFNNTGNVQKYPQFNPHITFSKRFSGDLKILPQFGEEITLYASSFKFKY